MLLASTPPAGNNLPPPAELKFSEHSCYVRELDAANILGDFSVLSLQNQPASGASSFHNFLNTLIGSQSLVWCKDLTLCVFFIIHPFIRVDQNKKQKCVKVYPMLAVFR